MHVIHVCTHCPQSMHVLHKWVNCTMQYRDVYSIICYRPFTKDLCNSLVKHPWLLDLWTHQKLLPKERHVMWSSTDGAQLGWTCRYVYHAEERAYLNILRMQGDYSRVVDDKESIKEATLFTPTQKEIRIANWINSKYSGLVLTTWERPQRWVLFLLPPSLRQEGGQGKSWRISQIEVSENWQCPDKCHPFISTVSFVCSVLSTMYDLGLYIYCVTVA